MNLKEIYKTEIVPQLQKELGIKNPYAVPRIKKIIVNVGIGSYVQKYKDFSDVIKNITTITGQKPIVINSRVAISNFKLRKDMPVGIKATLRKDRMYQFLFKLIHVTFPRLRDFRGFSPTCLDGQGNLNIGIKDYTVFPEIIPEGVTKSHGLQICITTSAKNNDEAKALFQAMKFPFKK